MAATSAYSTPINTMDKNQGSSVRGKNLILLVRKNILNNSFELAPEQDSMETDSPVCRPKFLQTVIKKLFHSPIGEGSPERSAQQWEKLKKQRRTRKRKLIPDVDDKIERAYVRETNKDGCSPEPSQGMRKRVLISLFNNKEYSMDCED